MQRQTTYNTLKKNMHQHLAAGQQTSPYLLSVVAPYSRPVPYPDGTQISAMQAIQMTQSVTITDLAGFLNNYRLIQKTNTSFQGIAVERYGTDPATGVTGYFLVGFLTGTQIADNPGTYKSLRQVSSVVQISCSTRAAGNQDVNGVINAIRLDTLPPQFGSARVNDMVDYATHGSSRLNLSIMEGLVMTSPFSSNIGFRKPQQPRMSSIPGWYQPTSLATQTMSQRQYYLEDYEYFLPLGGSSTYHLVFAVAVEDDLSLLNMQSPGETASVTFTHTCVSNQPIQWTLRVWWNFYDMSTNTFHPYFDVVLASQPATTPTTVNAVIPFVIPTFFSKFEIFAVSGSPSTLTNRTTGSMVFTQYSFEPDGDDQAINVAELSNLEAGVVININGVQNIEYQPGKDVYSLVPRQPQLKHNNEMYIAMLATALLSQAGYCGIYSTTEYQAFMEEFDFEDFTKESTEEVARASALLSLPRALPKIIRGVKAVKESWPALQQASKAIRENYRTSTAPGNLRMSSDTIRLSTVFNQRYKPSSKCAATARKPVFSLGDVLTTKSNPRALAEQYVAAEKKGRELGIDMTSFKAEAVERVLMAINPESKVEFKDPVSAFDLLASNKEAVYQLQSFLPPKRPEFNNRYVMGIGQKATNRSRKVSKFRATQQEPPRLVEEAIVQTRPRLQSISEDMPASDKSEIPTEVASRHEPMDSLELKVEYKIQPPTTDVVVKQPAPLEACDNGEQEEKVEALEDSPPVESSAAETLAPTEVISLKEDSVFQLDDSKSCVTHDNLPTTQGEQIKLVSSKPSGRRSRADRIIQRDGVNFLELSKIMREIHKWTVIANDQTSIEYLEEFSSQDNPLESHLATLISAAKQTLDYLQKAHWHKLKDRNQVTRALQLLERSIDEDDSDEEAVVSAKDAPLDYSSISRDIDQPVRCSTMFSGNRYRPKVEPHVVPKTMEGNAAFLQKHFDISRKCVGVNDSGGHSVIITVKSNFEPDSDDLTFTLDDGRFIAFRGFNRLAGDEQSFLQDATRFLLDMVVADSMLVEISRTNVEGLSWLAALAACMYGLPAEWHYTGAPAPMSNWLAIADMPLTDFKQKVEFVKTLGSDQKLFAVFASTDQHWTNGYQDMVVATAQDGESDQVIAVEGIFDILAHGHYGIGLFQAFANTQPVQKGVVSQTQIDLEKRLIQAEKDNQNLKVKVATLTSQLQVAPGTSKQKSKLTWFENMTEKQLKSGYDDQWDVLKFLRQFHELSSVPGVNPKRDVLPALRKHTYSENQVREILALASDNIIITGGTGIPNNVMPHIFNKMILNDPKDDDKWSDKFFGYFGQAINGLPVDISDVTFSFRGRLYPFTDVYHRQFEQVNQRRDLWPQNISNFNFEMIRNQNIIPLGVYRAIRKAINGINKEIETGVLQTAETLKPTERKKFKSNLSNYPMFVGLPGMQDPAMMVTQKQASTTQQAQKQVFHFKGQPLAITKSKWQDYDALERKERKATAAKDPAAEPIDEDESEGDFSEKEYPRLEPALREKGLAEKRGHTPAMARPVKNLNYMLQEEQQ